MELFHDRRFWVVQGKVMPFRFRELCFSHSVSYGMVWQKAETRKGSLQGVQNNQHLSPSMHEKTKKLHTIQRRRLLFCQVTDSYLYNNLRFFWGSALLFFLVFINQLERTLDCFASPWNSAKLHHVTLKNAGFGCLHVSFHYGSYMRSISNPT